MLGFYHLLDAGALKMARKPSAPVIEPKIFRNVDEIDRAISRLQRRNIELDQIDFVAAVREHTGADDAAKSSIRNTILEIYGAQSPEYDEHKHLIPPPERLESSFWKVRGGNAWGPNRFHLPRTVIRCAI